MNLFWFYFALYTVFIAAIVVLLLNTTGTEIEHVTETTDTMEVNDIYNSLCHERIIIFSPIIYH